MTEHIKLGRLAHLVERIVDVDEVTSSSLVPPTMETNFESKKLEWCKVELRALLERLIAGNYHQTAEMVFDHIAHTGVETDLNPDLKNNPSLDTFLQSK